MKNLPQKFILILIVIYIPLLLFSLWQYHLKILWANYNLNQAEATLGQNNFPRAFQKYEKSLEINTATLNPYLRYRYGAVILSFANFNRYLQREQNLEILKRGIDLQEKNAKKEWPYFTRNYVVAGQLSNFLFESSREEYKEIAKHYFNKALELSPQRPSIYLEMAKTDIIAQDYLKAEEKIKKAMAIDESNKMALWPLLLLRIRQKKPEQVKTNFKEIVEFGYNFFSFDSLNELAWAYEEAGDFEKAIRYYQRLSYQWPEFLIYEKKAEELLAKNKTKE